MQQNDEEQTYSSQTGSLNGFGRTLESIIKIEDSPPSLQEGINEDGLGDTLDNHNIKFEELPWWQNENKDEFLQMKENSNNSKVLEQRIKDGNLRDNTFSRNGKLKSHMNVHVGDRPFKCSQCEKTFSQNSNLITHMTVHSGEKPYQCSLCIKA
ncbi:unnamed protein product, partial [Meganyctiphanes norvegica]